MRILNRYIISEILAPLLLGMTLLAVVFGMGHLRKYGDAMMVGGLNMWELARLFLLVLPMVAQYLVPVSFLVAILLTFGRMSRDGEVLAARACGLHFGALAVPVVCLGAVLTISLFFCADRVAPWALIKVESIVENMVLNASGRILQPGRWIEGSNGLLFYIGSIDEDGELHNVKIDYSSKDREPVHVDAQSGRLTNIGHESVLVLNHCEIISAGQMAKTSVERAEVRLSRAFAAMREDQKPLEKRNKDTLQLSQLLKQARIPGISEKQRYRAWHEAGERVSLPFACLAFAFVGTSLGARALGGGRPYALGIALPTVGAYYAFMLLGQTISEVTQLNPMITSWLPNVIVGGAGAVMTYRAARA